MSKVLTACATILDGRFGFMRSRVAAAFTLVVLLVGTGGALANSSAAATTAVGAGTPLYSVPTPPTPVPSVPVKRCGVKTQQSEKTAACKKHRKHKKRKRNRSGAKHSKKGKTKHKRHPKVVHTGKRTQNHGSSTTCKNEIVQGIPVTFCP